MPRRWRLAGARVERNRKQRRNLKQLHRDLVALGYRRLLRPGGGVCPRLAPARTRSGRTGPAAAPLCRWRLRRARRSSSTGARTGSVIGGEPTKLQVAHFKLCHSRAFMLRAYPLQTHEMLFDAHNHAFARSGRRSRARHLRQHEDRGRQGRPRQAAPGQRALPGDGQSLPVRGRVLQPGRRLGEGPDREERADARHRIWHDAPRSPDLAALNAWLEQRCLALWHEIRHPEQRERTVAEVWADERPH